MFSKHVILIIVLLLLHQRYDMISISIFNRKISAPPPSVPVYWPVDTRKHTQIAFLCFTLLEIGK